MKNNLTKIIFITIFISFIFLSNAFAQDFKVDVFDEKQADKSIDIYVTNTFPCPLTLKITFSNVKNLCDTKERTFLVSANTDKKMLFTVKQCDTKKSYSYNYNFKYYYGDLSLSKYDKDFQYTLPLYKTYTNVYICCSFPAS